MEVLVGRSMLSSMHMLVAVVFQCTQVQISSAVACNFVSGSTCKCTLVDGSGEIDLTPLFVAGPLSVQGTGAAAGITFTYDACTPVPCGNKCDQGGGCLACEDGGGPNVFGIGSVDSAKMGDVSTSEWTFTMSYSNSEQNKASHVTYKLAASGGTQFSFTGEDPTNTYNMAVSGCFNTPTTTCPASKQIPCKVYTGNPCACSLEDGSGVIDLKPIFQGPLLTKGYGDVFLYDACKAVGCGSHCINCSGCQLSSTGDVWGLGTLASTNITATSMPDGRWALTALYSNPEQGKRFTVYYTVEPSGSAPEFQFVTETPSSVIFSLHGCFNTPKSSCATLKHI